MSDPGKKRGFTLRRRDKTSNGSEVFRELSSGTPQPTGTPSVGVPRRMSQSSDGALQSHGNSALSPRVEDEEEVRRREKEGEQKLKEAMAVLQQRKELARQQAVGGTPAFVPDPSKTEEENAQRKKEFDGELKLAAAVAQLHQAKEQAAKTAATQPKPKEIKEQEKSQVSSYLQKFTKKLIGRKGKSAKEEDVPAIKGVEGTSSALKPGQQPKVAAPDKTPNVPRAGKTDAEKSVNEISKEDSYLNRFLEDKEDAPMTKQSRRRSGTIATRPAITVVEEEEVKEAAKGRSAAYRVPDDRRRSQNMMRTSSDQLTRHLAAKAIEAATAAEKAKSPERGASKSLSGVSPSKDRKHLPPEPKPVPKVATASRTSTVESDVEESSTFESDDDDEQSSAASSATSSSKSGKGKKVGGKSPVAKAGNLRKSSSAAVLSPSKSTTVVATPAAVSAPTPDRPLLEPKKLASVDGVNSLYKLGQELGKGGFSVVYQATRLADKLEVAMKVVELAKLTKKQLAELDAERFILQQFQHPYVVNLLDVLETPTHLYLVLELLPGGDLFTKIVQKGCFSERATKRIIQQVTEAVNAMHALGIVHRDLKPENILCIEDPKTKQIDVKVADFGIAKKIGRTRATSTCIPEDHQILTNRGFMDLDDWLQHRHDPEVLVAGYDAHARAIVFERPVRDFVLERARRGFVDFCGSNLGYMVTEDHKVFVEQKSGRGFAKVDAVECLTNGWTSARHVAVAENGLQNQNEYDNAVVQASTEELEAFGRLLWCQLDVAEAFVADLVWNCCCNRADRFQRVISGLLQVSGGRPLKIRSARMRDDIVRLFLFAGMSATFSHCSNDEELFVVSVSSESFPVASQMRRLERECRVWCLTMPSGLFWVRRARRNGAGVVVEASAPVVTGNCGSPGYVAPEVIRGEEYDEAVDMFSLGAIVYVMLAGFPPFWGDDAQTILAKNLSVDYTFADAYWGHVSPEAKSFIDGLLNSNPQERMTAEQALKHVCYAHAQPSYTDLTDAVKTIYACFAARNISCILSTHEDDAVYVSYDLPYLASTGQWNGKKQIVDYFKLGASFYNYSNFDPNLSGLPWAVDINTRIVAVPALAKGSIVTTKRSATSHNLHYWQFSLRGLVSSWTQWKVTYLEEPIMMQ